MKRLFKWLFSTESKSKKYKYEIILICYLILITATVYIIFNFVGLNDIVETILTFIFVLVVLATTKKENCFSGLVIGLTLTLVHIFGIVFTGTSVNPARSIGPALLTGGDALSQLWVFILAPLLGGILAAVFYRFVLNEEAKPKLVSAYKTVIEEVEDDEDEEEIEEEPEEEVKPKARKPRKKSK